MKGELLWMQQLPVPVKKGLQKILHHLSRGGKMDKR